MWTRNAVLPAGAALIAISCLAGMQQQPHRPTADGGNQPAEESVQYARRQLEIAQQALRQLEQGIEQGAVSPIDPQYAAWSQRIVDAYRALGDVEGYVAALQQHVERLERIVDARETFRRRGALTELQMLEIEYFLAEARHQLAEGRRVATREGRGTEER